MRVLGIDPGLTRCGVGVVDVAANRAASFVHVSVIQTLPGEALERRLLRVSQGLEQLFDEYKPDEVALERVFAQQNVRTVMGTAQVSGIVLLAAAQRSLRVGLRTPTEVKAAVTGYGQANKKQVGTMVAKILKLDAVPRPADAADALALAICHAWQSPLGQLTDRGTQEAVGSEKKGMTAAQAAWRAAEQAAGRSVSARKLAR